MTLAEFKAWLDGYDAAINGAPTAEQWDAIKAKLATVDVFPTYPPAASISPYPASPSIAPQWPRPYITCGGSASTQVEQ